MLEHAKLSATTFRGVVTLADNGPRGCGAPDAGLHSLTCLHNAARSSSPVLLIFVARKTCAGGLFLALHVSAASCLGNDSYNPAGAASANGFVHYNSPGDHYYGRQAKRIEEQRNQSFQGWTFSPGRVTQPQRTSSKGHVHYGQGPRKGTEGASDDHRERAKAQNNQEGCHCDANGHQGRPG